MSGSDTRQHDLRRQGARLRLIVPLAAGEDSRSWLGGCPHLPDPFSWPQRDGKPLHFVGQIDCAALPRDIWGGLGPRTGWLAFFVGMGERICAEVVHAPQLGPKRTPPAQSRFYFLPSMLGAVPEIYDERRHNGYDFFPNCTSNAFEVATQTLTDRVTSYGATDTNVRNWLDAQARVRVDPD